MSVIDLGGPVSLDVIERLAVRAIARDQDGRVLLLRAAAGDYKFPGGGVDPGEAPRDALARELDEECGRDLLDIGPLVVRALERRSARRPGAVLEMESRYYSATVSAQLRDTRQEAYERDLGLHADWVDLSEAITANAAAVASGSAPPWTARELAVLRFLLARDPQG